MEYCMLFYICFLFLNKVLDINHLSEVEKNNENKQTNALAFLTS